MDDFLSINLKNYKFELSSNNVLKITGGVIACASTFYLWKIWLSYSFWKKRGIPTPEFEFFWGNNKELYENQYSIALQEWTKRFGKLYGYYCAQQPILVTTDIALINDVFVKYMSSNFSGRKYDEFKYKDNGLDDDLVDYSHTKWKRLRNLINPTFTPAKLKEMLPLMALTTDRLVEIIEKNLNKEINISSNFNAFTMDTIWNTAFGLDIDCQNDSDNIYLKKANEFFTNANSPNLMLDILIYFKEFKIILLPIIKFNAYILSKFTKNANAIPSFWLQRNVSAIINERIEKKIYKKDFMQLLIDGLSFDYDSRNDQKHFEIKDRLEKKLTFNELNSNIYVFLLAGYETTSTTLSYSLHTLATHPEETKKLQEEMDTFLMNTNELNYDNISQLEYLDMFIKEVLRMHPIGNFVVNRRCTEPINIRGIQFEKGMVLAVDVLSMHYSKELWGPEDPNKFYPPRHAKECKRNPAGFYGFGYGPRKCVAERFALIEIKLALAKLLMQYDVVKGPNTVEKLEYSERLSVRQPKNGVFCIIKQRNN